MSEFKYFKRKVNEGTIKATHVCSFDPSIVLTKIAQNGRKVIDSVVISSANAGNSDLQKQQQFIKGELMHRIASIRINGLPTVYEDLGECFDDDEIIEVIAFINGADMSKFGGVKQSKEEEKEEELKNA